MKIIHICLASHYTENMNYQENQLADQNAKDGHDVIVVADCYAYKGANIIEVPEEDKLLSSGVRLIRLKYVNIINNVISSKIKKVKNLIKIIEEFGPDVILFHGAIGLELLTVAEYKKKNPSTKLYIDSHQDVHNSGTFWLSMFFQYRIFNNIIIKKIEKFVDKFLFISYEAKDFLKETYNLPEFKMEFFPLGGNVVSKDEKLKYSINIRKKHNLPNSSLIIVHSGKLESSKKTKELLDAFYKVKDIRLKLFIIGSIPKNMQPILEPLILRDNRVEFLGWKTANELVQYLCSANLYFQPGTQSATMQNAICCGTAIALYPYKSHEPYLKNNGFYVSSEEDYINVLHKICKSPSLLDTMSDSSLEIANNILDYRVLAARLYV